MAYVDGFMLAVPTIQRAAYQKIAEEVATVG
jgi:uncharacterized protein YbaA (DUF1428 family)